MHYVDSVAHWGATRNHLDRLGPVRTVGLQAARADALRWFVRGVVRSGASRITVVSPWLGAYDIDDLGFLELIAWAQRTRARLTLVTRSPTTSQHQRAVEAVASIPGGVVLFNERLHAKLYVSDSEHGDGFAVMGSANMTRSSTRLHEIGAVIRPRGDGRILRDLVGVVMTELRSDFATRRLTRSISHGRAREGAR
jgi:hypothetical protein